MRQPRRNNSLKYFIVSVLLILTLAYYNGEFENQLISTANEITLTKQSEQHILYGDHKGGGHIYGANKPCKSEFPEDWDEKEIITTVKKLASNDNANWERQNNGYYVSEQRNDGIKVRIIIDGKKQNIITAYPINTPRNPCNNN